MDKKVASVSEIVVPAPKPAKVASRFVGTRLPRLGLQQQWAPAWFYSALSWLGKTYYDANHVAQSFNVYMAGSDVDPYARIGSTRLFLIVRVRESFRLTIAPDTDSLAPSSGGTLYAATDEGIRDMYVALSESPIFHAVRYCYVPGRIGRDLDPDPEHAPGVAGGYDPATGLRAVVLGSAVSQVVPLDDFMRTHNEQIYNPSPTIVPLVTALVYDVTHHNALGARSFVLPVVYARDRIAGSTHTVSKLGATSAAGDVAFASGQTVVFAGGPGYDDAAATSLQLIGTTQTDIQGQLFTTYTFDKAKVVTIAKLGAKLRTGVTTLTVDTTSPASVFANQRIIGFYREPGWTNCLGLPMYDYGEDNPRFTAETADPLAPVTIYDPAHPFLSGGSLQNVVARLREAAYLYPWDRLVATLDAALASEGRAGLAVTAAALDFDLRSTPAGEIVDHLAVPVVVTATTTPPKTPTPVRRAAGRPPVLEAAVAKAVVIGSGANTPHRPPSGPVTVQVGLTAFVPREALDGTGITSLEIGTPFVEQSLGAADAFHAAAPVTLNLMERRGGHPALAPFDLVLAGAKVAFKPGLRYVLALHGATLSVRGSDGSSASVAIANPADRDHTFVGAMRYSATTKTVRLYPKLRLELAAPAVGTHGVQQGERYSVRLTFGDKTSTYDLVDALQARVASDVGVHTPEVVDGSPRKGDVYFGSFLGGAARMTVWSVPVFLTVGPADLPGAGDAGTIALDAQVSGVPGYELQITDSSLFVYANIDLAAQPAGSAGKPGVFLASAVINSAPDDTSATAFAPCKLVMGLVRPARMGTAIRYVFVPAEDSVVIGTTRYMPSVVELDALDFDPDDRPYPPMSWPQTRYWQFANRHNPYLDVGYAGATQDDRIARARQDTARIGLGVVKQREPMHMYLDTDREVMRIWPIYGFPFDRVEQTVDLGRLTAITGAVLELLATAPAVTRPLDPGPLAAERVTVPDALRLANPFAVGAPSAAATGTAVAAEVLEPGVIGKRVTNLSPGAVARTLSGLDAVRSARALDDQKAAVEVAAAKLLAPAVGVVQNRAVLGVEREAAARRERQRIYGFSVYNPRTGEAYLVELVDADQDVPDQLPRPTEHLTYDPYYVRVVFLNTLTCYNMSIIVPAMVHDQYGHFARQGIEYHNLLGKTDELSLGYLSSIFDESDRFDTLKFGPYPAAAVEAMIALPASSHYLFTNIPYSTEQTRPGAVLAALLEHPEYRRIPPPYFVCRRKNWAAECHLMQAFHPPGKSIYLAFGAGDLVPFRLDAAFRIDKRAPAHLYKLTYTFSDRPYDAAKTISVANKPYVVAVTTQDGIPQYRNFSINATAGTAELSISENRPLAFPTEVHVVGQASATLTSIDRINAQLGSGLANTGDFMTLDDSGNVIGQEFELIPYNNLVYMIRAVANVPALGVVGGLGVVSGLLVDTFVPATTGNLALAQGARHKRSGLPYFGANYTPTTMVDTLDNLDFTSITGETFHVPTIFIPIPELDATRGVVADISNFLGQQFWTLIYPEIVARAGETVNSVTWPDGLNLDAEGKPVLSLQKLHFVFDPLVVMFTPNDLAHKYALSPKQQVLALTNGQIQEAICWRSANVQPQRNPPTNICAQQIVPAGPGMDRPNIIYSPHNRPVATSSGPGYLGMSVHSFRSVSGVRYAIEESALQGDQTGTSFISAVSSTTNLLVGVLFDYDNNDLGTLDPYDPDQSTKGVVFINGYLGASGYAFSSPDHFDVNDVLPSQVPWLDQIANTMGEDVALFNTDVSLPRQFWSMAYDTFTAPGLPNFIPNVPPSAVDPTFSNRTRSLILSLQNPVRPQQLGLMDTYSSVVSANLHLENGVTGSVFISKKADRDVASIGTNPPGGTTFPLFGLPTKYDFFIFSRDHYWTLKGASFELIDHGYAMVLVDDGTGTGSKVARYSIDAAGNYYELVSYALYSPNGGVIESSTFTLKVAIGSDGTPNTVNPQDIAAQINRASNLIYAAFGPASPGQPPASIPIQAVGGAVQASPIAGPPGFDGYLLNVAGANRQPVRISQIHAGATAYAIAGPTTIVPLSAKTGRAQAFLGSLSHGLDRMLPVPQLQSADGTSVIPRPTVPPGPSSGTFGGNGLGALIGTPLSRAFQGAGAVPPAVAGNPSPGTTMKADDTVFYTFNAVTGTVMDSTGKAVSVTGGQYFVDRSDPANPIFGVVTLPRFTLNGNTYAIALGARHTLVVGGKRYAFDADNRHVTVDRTRFTFNPALGGGYTVGYAALDQPATDQSPSPVALTPFAIAAGGKVATLDVFNDPGALHDIVLGVTGRLYTYDPVLGQVAIREGAATTTVPLATGATCVSSTGYGYVIAYEDGQYTVNGGPMFPYAAATTGAPASHALMTAPQMFTIDGNFYTFDRDPAGGYVSVTGDRQTTLVNPYQFSINGVVYIINTNVQPNTVVGGGNIYPMTAGNTQFVLGGVQYTIALRQGSLNGATISGQFNITQGNVVVIEDYVYQIDNLNGQIVGNGSTYPLTTSGTTYTITTADRSFTVTTEPNATTVTIGNVVYQINNTTVVGDGVAYPILVYRTFVDGATKFTIGNDGVVYLPPPLALVGSTFTDGATYTVDQLAAFDGTSHVRITGTPPQFTAAGRTYTLRSDGVSIPAGGARTYLVKTTGAPSPNQFAFGPQTIFFGRPADVAAFDGAHYFAIADGQFTDTTTGRTYTLSGNTAVHEGDSYEIFSNLGQGAYFEVPGGPIYYVDIPVADTGSATGDIFHVFPISGGQFTIPLPYTITVAGGVATVAAATLAAPTPMATLTGAGAALTGGYFVDPVTKITYTCVIDGTAISFVDSNNAIYPFAANRFVASVVVATGVSLAVDDQPAPGIYPILNNQFVDGPRTFSVNVPIAYANPAGPYFPMVNGRFIVPRTAPRSDLAYTVRGATVTKGYPVSADDVFSVDGNVVYTVNAVNVVKATNQATLSGASPTQTLVAGGLTYNLDETQARASVQPPGLVYDSVNHRFTVSYNGLPVTYTVGASVTDDRQPQNSFTLTTAGTQLTFADTVGGVTFTWDGSGANPITARFVYTNHFFIDPISGVTYYIDEADGRVEAISYLPETTQYAFTAADGQTYLIHYDDVDVVFPVVAGSHVNAGVATVGSDIFTVEIDRVDPSGGGPAIPINVNSFEINGNLYTITGTPVGPDYSSCHVAGNDLAPRPFLSPNTFRLTDPAITYTLQLDAANLPSAVVASFPIRPSRNLVTVNDSVYIITSNTVTTGSLLGQGQAAIAIAGSSFTLTNRLDATRAKFSFASANIYDAASVVGQFTVYLAPTFFLDSVTYTLDPVQLVVTDDRKRPYPLLPNPTMFSINGFNYAIDTNRIPHAIVGNGNVSPLSTDVTVERGRPIPHSTFTLGGLVYKYTEDASGNLLAITGTKSFLIAQPAQTFKLDSSLVFTLSTAPPAAGNYPGSVAPIGTVTAGTLVVNVYAGTPESGGADFFTYKNVLYTLVESSGVHVAVQKSYTVYASRPAANQQQLAVFDLDGTTYLVTDGSTPGTPAAGINPNTMWAATSGSSVETQFGLVHGFTAQPTSVTRSGTGVFQFQALDAAGTTTLYDILYAAGGNANVVKVDVPALLPTFTQTGPFTFTPSYPLTFETGGYNAFTTFVAETSTPSLSFAGAYKTPVTSSDPRVDTLITERGDFSLEFWHSIPASTPGAYHPVTYAASTATPLVYYLDLDFEDASNIYVGINNVVLRAVATPPVFSSGWRHVALTYQQPYTMLCHGAGFEVKNGSSYNFNRDFSIAMTFSVSDAATPQGLLYKGTGSDVTSPQTTMSYRVAVSGGRVTLQLTDGNAQVSQEFLGAPAVENDRWYQLIIVKHTTTPAGREGNPDPYVAPFDTTDLGALASGGVSGTGQGLGDDGAITISSVAPAGTGATTRAAQFLETVANPPPKGYEVAIAVRVINDDGTFGAWQVNATTATTDDAGLIVNSTGAAHLLIGHAFDDSGRAVPLGGDASAGNIRKVYLFNSAINRDGIQTDTGSVDIANATSDDLVKAGLVGYWTAQYDPDGLVPNPYDPPAVAMSTNNALAQLAPLSGHEREGAVLYANGYQMTLSLVTGDAVPDSMTGFSAGAAELTFNAGLYRLAEISLWRMVRQPYQVIDDMFGRLIPTNEPLLIVYLSGSFLVQAINAPILPMKKYIDNIAVVNPVAAMNLAFAPASLDLAGCPAVGRCGPLVTPNLYTPPGVALTVCDTVPYLTTYSVTLNTLTGTLAGVINEAYVYVKDHVLTLYAGKKVGDLVLTWVSQEQGDVQLIGYVEGAPPAPMANLTNKASYAGATSLTFSAPTSLAVKYQKGEDSSWEHTIELSYQLGAKYKTDLKVAPFGLGVGFKEILDFSFTAGLAGKFVITDGDSWQKTASNKLDESNKYTVKLQGALAPVTGDPFMASLNTLTTPSATPGNPSSKTAILPNPNLGGFTSSNPPAALPKVPSEEKFGARMYVPSPYGQAFVTSTTLDVYQQTLLQTNTVYGFVRIPNAQIPRDLNIVSFRMNSKYLRPGCIDGVVGYVYNPATLPTGARTYATSTGQMQVLHDKNFSSGSVGHDASYMRIVEAYKLKRQIDQQAFNAIALYHTQYDAKGMPDDSRLTPGLDFYNEYLWSARGGTQEVKHTYTTSYDEVIATSHGNTYQGNVNFNLKLAATGVTVMDFKFGYTLAYKSTTKYQYNTTGTSSFDIAASFDGIENDTQMRYGCNNDAHFVMKFNSMFNPGNQSGLNLVIGSDGLVYNIAPNVSSGAGLPASNNIDDSQTYMQPQPSYTSGNANGITGALEPYDRPGKVKQFRTYAFFLQPTEANADDFWTTVVDPVWLANSEEPDARAMRSAQEHKSIPWRVLYRVTYCERFLPPVSTEAIVVPQITPVMAVPVLNPATDFVFKPIGEPGPRPAHNPANDIEANIVLVAPTASGARAGTPWPTGPSAGLPVLPNNVIPFDLVKGVTSIVNWGDSTNAKLLAQLLTSVLGLSTVAMSPTVLPGSTRVLDVMDPAGGGPLYSVYTDPNGLTVNVPVKFGITVYQDVNGNPIQYFDGKTFFSLQADHVATTDGTVMYYLQPPSTYDQSTFDLAGDYDLFGRPGDAWRYYLVSGMSANMTSEPTVAGLGPFLSSTGSAPYTGFTIAGAQHASSGANQVKGYVLCQGILQWPHLNTNAETFADVLVYKAMSLLDTFPIGDPAVMNAFLKAQYAGAPFVDNEEICLVFVRNIVSYFNALQQALIPQ